MGLVYVLANLGVFAAYATIPMTRIGRAVPVTVRVKVAAMLFFATCAFTHLTMALYFHNLWLETAVDVLQACAAWYFVIGFSNLIKAAEVQRRRPRPDGPGEAPHGCP